jgi:hypothetical protein
MFSFDCSVKTGFVQKEGVKIFCADQQEIKLLPAGVPGCFGTGAVWVQPALIRNTITRMPAITGRRSFSIMPELLSRVNDKLFILIRRIARSKGYPAFISLLLDPPVWELTKTRIRSKIILPL